MPIGKKPPSLVGLIKAPPPVLGSEKYKRYQRSGARCTNSQRAARTVSGKRIADGDDSRKIFEEFPRAMAPE